MKKIVLIEDNQEIRESMAEILNLAGYKVYTAENGKSGASLALEHQPDLIICDIMMPVLDGYGVIHLLHKHMPMHHIPFIFISAKTERMDVRKGMDLGADDYLTKPFDGTELLNVVEARLKKSEFLKEKLQPNLNGVSQLMRSLGERDYMEDLKEGRNINRYKKKQLIYSEGNQPARLFYVLKGKVKTFKRNTDGKELIINLYKAGDFLGYRALLENCEYRESAEALEDTELALIPKSDFEELLNSNFAVMRKFINILAENLDMSENQLLAVAYNSLRKKVADSLITLYDKYNAERAFPFYIDLSRENLASIAGVAKESLIRTLGDFKQEKLITIEDNRISIVNYDKLRKMHN